MSQLESLIAIIEQAKNGMNSIDAAQKFLLMYEGQRVKKVVPQMRRCLTLTLWGKPSYSTKRIALALGITEKRVRQIISSRSTFGSDLPVSFPPSAYFHHKKNVSHRRLNMENPDTQPCTSKEPISGWIGNNVDYVIDYFTRLERLALEAGDRSTAKHARNRIERLNKEHQ